LSLPHPHEALIRDLQASPDRRDQALAVILFESQRQSKALFGEPETPELGLIGRVQALEVFRKRMRTALAVAFPTVLTLLFGLVTALRNLRELIAPKDPPAFPPAQITSPLSLERPRRTPHEGP
jgi:hypothetical protein